MTNLRQVHHSPGRHLSSPGEAPQPDRVEHRHPCAGAGGPGEEQFLRGAPGGEEQLLGGAAREGPGREEWGSGGREAGRGAGTAWEGPAGSLQVSQRSHLTTLLSADSKL